MRNSTAGVELARLSTADADFEQRLETLCVTGTDADSTVEKGAREIILEVRRRGDDALVEFTNRFDRRQVAGAAELVLDQNTLRGALKGLDRDTRAALEQAAERIRDYHLRQKLVSWTYTEQDGTVLGQRVTALERVGVYVPGGKAAYPSSVLMNVIPASVAGVDEVVMVVPAPDGHINPLVLAAAALAGVHVAFSIGGAQAIAALAYGTPTVQAVHKIVGPGNAWVATAKRLVFGTVGIDMVAGPSEIVVVSDGSVPADWIAIDLFSQAEHDEEARAMLVSPDAAHLDEVHRAMNELLVGMERRDIIRASLAAHGALVLTRDLGEAMEVANRLAPEHLELAVVDADHWLAEVRHAGAVFLGAWTPEALGDYCAGPNHVLPTARTARFSSALGVYDFQKRSSVIRCTPAGARRLAPIAAKLAREEGLTAHARSAELRAGNRGPGGR